MLAEHSSNSQEINISSTRAPLHIKFALVGLSKFVIPKWLGSLLFFLSHLQVLAMIIKTTYLALPDNTPSASPIIKLFVKLFVVGDWLDYNNNISVVIGIVMITLYNLKMLGMMVYIHLCLYHKRKIPDLIQSYWSVVHRLHTLLLFLWIHTFCVDIGEYPSESKVANSTRMAIITMAFLNTVISCGLAAFFSIIVAIYKTKDVMSAKTYLLETKNIVLKILIPVLWRLAAENNQRVHILSLVLIVLHTISQDWVFIRYLPYYRIRILLLSAILQAAETSLALISFIIKVIEASRTKTIGVYSIWMIWLLALPIFAKLYYSFTWKILIYIFGCRVKDEKNIAYLVHKSWILLHFLKSRKSIHKGINKFSIADMMYQARMSEIVENSGVTFKEFDEDKMLLTRNLKNIYMEVLRRDSRAILAQISLADLFSDFEDLYLVSNNLLEDAISKKPGYQAQISLNLIRFELQKKLKAQFSEKSGEGLNLSSYIINHELFEEMKKVMEKQARLQLDFWKEFSSNTAKMLNLVKIILKVKDQRIVVKKLWNNLLKVRCASFLSPLRVYGMYSSLINNDPIEGEKYARQLRDDAKRMHKNFRADELTNETIFSDKSVKITMSGLRASLGEIIDCSNNITDFYGWRGSDMKGRSIESLMPPFFRQRHDGFLLKHFNTGKSTVLNKTLILPVKRSNGYIHASWVHAKVSPFMCNGLSYVALLRACKSSQRIVLLCKDGKVDDMCIGFAKDMHLVGRQVESAEIFTLCPELKNINEAFNVVAEDIIIDAKSEAEHKNHFYSPPKKSTNEKGKRFFADSEMEFRTKKSNVLPSQMDKDKAQAIYDIFNNGSTLTFRPHNAAASEAKAYRVKIFNSIHGKDVIKFILLEREGNSEEAGLSQEEEAFSSAQMKAKKLYDSQIKIPYSSRRIVQNQSVPAAISETERAELMLFTTSPRLKTDLKAPEPNNNHDDDDDTNLSVSDEVQDDDFTARKTIIRNVLSKVGSSNSNFGSSTPERAIEDQMLKSALVKTEEAKIKKKAQTHNTLDQREETKGEEVVVQIEKSTGYSFATQGKKIKQMVVRTLNGDPKTKSPAIFMYLSILFMILMIILLIIQNQTLHSGINDVELQMPVMSRGYWRIYQMTTATSVAMVWMEALKGTFPVDWESFNSDSQSLLTIYAEKAHLYNTEFFELLSKLPLEIQEKTYGENVGMYEYDENINKILIGKYSTFDAFQLINEKQFSCSRQVIPDHFVAGIDTTNFKYITDNSLNDLLIQADHQNVQLVQGLNDSMSFTTLKIILTLAIVLIICFIFILISIRYLWVICSEMKIFMTILFRIKLEEGKTTQFIIQQFLSALDWNAVMKEEKVPNIADSTSNNMKGSVKFRKASMSSFYRAQRITFMKFSPIYLLFIFWSLIYYFLASEFIANIKDSQKRMEAAMQALHDEGLFVHQSLTIPLTNGEALVKNEPIISGYLKSLDNLKESDHFVDGFRDRKGKLTALQEKVLFGFPCEDFLPILAESPENYAQYISVYESCLYIESRDGRVGLVYLRSTLLENGLNFFEQYKASNKTKEELSDLFLIVYSMNLYEMSIVEGFLILLNQVTEKHYGEQVDSIQHRALYFIIVTIIVTLIAVWMAWFFVINKIFRLQKVDWLILQIIPIHLILENKHLQQYLMRRSAGMLDSVKSYL